MEFIKKIVSFFKTLSFEGSNNISKLALYKIIDRNETKNDVYIIQCVNSKSIFEACISEIVCDKDILYGLHPLQACFIGIEYAQFSKSNRHNLKNHAKSSAIKSQVIQGILRLKYQDRKGDICFINCKTNKEQVMNPKDIAFSDNIISHFDSEQSFFIGMCAGKKICNSSENVIYFNSHTNRTILHHNYIQSS